MRLSQSELGERVGATRQAIAALENSSGRIATLRAVEPLVGLNIKGLTHGGDLIDRLRNTRLRDNRSLRDVAAAAGVAINTLREVEAGRGDVSSLLKIVEAVAPAATIRAGTTRSQRNGFVTIGRRMSYRHDPSDYFTTPAPVTRLLLDRETFAQQHPVLEPAVGRARAIDRVLRERGYQTTCFDLHGEGEEQQDFLSLTGRYCSLVTNPPFSLHVEFVQQARRLVDKKFALLMPINYLIGARRFTELWADRDFPLARVHVLTRGVNFLASDPHGDSFSPSQLYVAWFVFERSHQGAPEIRWIDCAPFIERKAGRKRPDRGQIEERNDADMLISAAYDAHRGDAAVDT